MQKQSVTKSQIYFHPNDNTVVMASGESGEDDNTFSGLCLQSDIASLAGDYYANWPLSDFIPFVGLAMIRKERRGPPA